MKKFMLIAALALFSLVLTGAEFYVSQTTGKKKAPGTKQAPFRAIPDALKKAKAGDVIRVAQGSYTGKMGASEIVIDKPVTLIGGYSPDFSARDVVKYPTMIQPKNEKGLVSSVSTHTELPITSRRSATTTSLKIASSCTSTLTLSTTTPMIYADVNSLIHGKRSTSPVTTTVGSITSW